MPSGEGIGLVRGVERGSESMKHRPVNSGSHPGKKVFEDRKPCGLCLFMIGYGVLKASSKLGFSFKVAQRWKREAGIPRSTRNATKVRWLNAPKREKQVKLPKPRKPKKVWTEEELKAKRDAVKARELARYYANHEERKEIGKQRARESYKEWSAEKKKLRFKQARVWRSGNHAARVANRMRGRLSSILRRGNAKAPTHLRNEKLISCTRHHLIDWIESQWKRGMRWENYGKTWVIDHILPCASFDLSVESEVLKCFHYSNLRPLCRQENAHKGAIIELCQPELLLAV